MAQFSVSTEKHTGGISPEQWNNTYLKNMNAEGDGMVEVVNKDGKLQHIPVNRAAVLFRDPHIMRAETRGNRGNAPAITASVVGFVDVYDIAMARDKITNHPLIEDGKQYMIVPIYYPTNIRNAFAIQIFGATWVDSGNYTLQPHSHHVGNMFLYSIQSVVWDLMNEKKESRMPTLIAILLKLVLAAKTYFKYDPKAFEIVKPLVDTDNAIDMLNRAVAFIFVDNVWTKLAVTRMLEISLKKWNKYNSKSDFVSEPILGIYGIVLAIPVLIDFTKNVLDETKTAKVINDRIMQMLQITADNIAKKGKELDKIIWFNLMAMSSVLKLSKEQTDTFYDFCTQGKNFGKLAPLEEWGFTEKLVLPFEAMLSGFVVGGRPSRDNSKIDEKLRITSTNARDWTGIGFKTPGIYKLRGSPVAGATLGQGNTQGKQSVSNARFVLGNDLMNNNIEGKSSAGMHRRCTFGRTWEWDNTKSPLDITDFELKIKPSGSFEIMQDGRMWFSLEQADFKMPVTIAYKFLNFDVEFKPLVAEQVPEQVAEQPGEEPEINLNGLSGSALIQQLAKMAFK